MRYRSLYFIPSAGPSPDASQHIVDALVQSIDTQCGHLHGRHDEHWTLTHRLFKSTTPLPGTSTDDASSSAAAGGTQPQTYKYHHLLHTSLLDPSLAYCYVHPQPPPTKSEPTAGGSDITPSPSQPSHQNAGTVIAIPSAQLEQQTQFLANTLAAQWVLRHGLQVTGGISYTISDYTIHIGALHSARNAAAPNTISPGVVVCIERNMEDIPGMDDTTAEEDQELLEQNREGMQAFWEEVILAESGLDIAGLEVKVMDMIAPPKSHTPAFEDAQAGVRLWCQALLLRG